MEKVNAMFEAGASLMTGGTANSVVERYREHVAANAKRLSHWTPRGCKHGTTSHVVP
jgi:2-iminoacetate synthase ThiH